MCLAQGHKAVMLVKLEPATPRSRVKHSTSESLGSPIYLSNRYLYNLKIIVKTDIIYSQTKVKHDLNIISETFFAYKFLQKNNKFVIFCYPCLPVVS